MNKKKLLIAVLALVLVLCAAVAPAMAYFTTYTRAQGGYVITLGARTEIDEEFSSWKKTVKIKNTEGQPVFLRARAFAGSAYTLTCGGDGWVEYSDGWWYYLAPVEENEPAQDWIVQIEDVPAAEKDLNFNVAVVYECIPAAYDSNGRALDPRTLNWDQAYTVKEGGNS